MRNFDVTVTDGTKEFHFPFSGMKKGEVWNRVRNSLKSGYKVIAVEEV